MSLCDSIDTLAMAYLDDELAPEERRELELHVGECAGCRARLDTERADHELIRSSLVAPRASDMLKLRVSRSLDAADAAETRAGRRRFGDWLLPGSAVIAAAAALVVFVSVRGPNQQAGAAIHEAVRQQTLQLPMDVQGTSTGPWVRQHIAPSFAAFDPPSFREPGVVLVGARAIAIEGRDAAHLMYKVDGAARIDTIVVFDGRPDDFVHGDDIQVGEHTLHLVEDRAGRFAITYMDTDRHIGYAFIAPQLTADQLVQLVASSSLIGGVSREH